MPKRLRNITSESPCALLQNKERIMLRPRWLIPSALLLFTSLAFAEDIAPGGTLRAAYLANNPAQSVRDPVNGEIRGASADLARELARRRNVPIVLIPLPNPPTVIEAVAKGDADIGFVAYAPERVGTNSRKPICWCSSRSSCRTVPPSVRLSISMHQDDASPAGRAIRLPSILHAI